MPRQAKNTLLIIVDELCVTSPGGLILDHALGLRERGLEVAILTGSGRLVREARRAKLEVLVRPLPRVRMLDYFFVRQLAREMRSLGTRLVHAYGTPVAQLAAQIAHKSECPWVLEVHSRSDALQARAFESESLHRILVPSEELRTQLCHKHSVPKSLLHILRPGIDTDRASPKTADNYVRMPVIGSCGPFLSETSHEELVRAIAQLNQAELPVQLMLMGDGPQRPTLWKLARELGVVDQIVFTGDQPSRAALFEILDIYVDCTPRGMLSHDLFEAMSRAILPIVYRGGSAYDLIEDHRTGRVVSSMENEDLARVLMESLALRKTSRDNIGHAARRRIQKEYPRGQHIDRCLSIYGEALQDVLEGTTKNVSDTTRRTSRTYLNTLGLLEASPRLPEIL